MLALLALLALRAGTPVKHNDAGVPESEVKPVSIKGERILAPN